MVCMVNMVTVTLSHNTDFFSELRDIISDCSDWSKFWCSFLQFQVHISWLNSSLEILSLDLIIFFLFLPQNKKKWQFRLFSPCNCEFSLYLEILILYLAITRKKSLHCQIKIAFCIFYPMVETSFRACHCTTINLFTKLLSQ